MTDNFPHTSQFVLLTKSLGEINGKISKYYGSPFYW